MRHVIFGTQRIATIYALRYGVMYKDTILATSPLVDQFIRGEKEVTVVRVPEDNWRPPTLPCEQRVREAEIFLRERKRNGVIIKEVTFV